MAVRRQMVKFDKQDIYQALRAAIVQSVQRPATGWTVLGSNPGVGGARFSALVQTGPGAQPASYTMGTESFPGGKAAGEWY